MTQVKSPTALVWILGRVYCTGTPEDYQAVHQLQDQFSSVPLSSYGKPYTPPPGVVDEKFDMKTAVRKQVNNMSLAEYFSYLLGGNPTIHYPDALGSSATPMIEWNGVRMGTVFMEINSSDFGESPLMLVGILLLAHKQALFDHLMRRRQLKKLGNALSNFKPLTGGIWPLSTCITYLCEAPSYFSPCSSFSEKVTPEGFPLAYEVHVFEVQSADQTMSRRKTKSK